MSDALTFSEMAANITDYFLNNTSCGLADAEQYGFRGANYCIESGIFEWWGMARNGEPVYAPIKPLPRAFVWVKVHKQ